MTLSEAAQKAIDLASKVSDYYEAELPKRYRNYPLVSPGEEDPPPPPEEGELQAFLESLSDEVVYQLISIMYLGRGDFGVNDLAEYYQDLKGTFGERQYVLSQMTGQAPLADYLLDGLEELRKHRIDVDRMPLKKTKSRKR
jgi:hypothetical protein